MSRRVKAIFLRELKGYFDTPVAMVFTIIFLMLIGILTFYAGNFYNQGNASLEPFFQWFPWLYLLFMPALSMRLWAEEKHLGTIELLLTLPVSPWQAVVAKFMAAWCFALIVLLLTFPMWVTVSYLGNPDHGVIMAGYVSAGLMAGAFLAIGSCVSAFTQNQVIAFVISITIGFLFFVSGLSMVLNFFEAIGSPQYLIDTISQFSLLTNFLDMSKGLIHLRHILFFVSLIVFFLTINTLYLMLQRRFRKSQFLFYGAIAIGLFMVVNLLASLSLQSIKIDFTDDQRFTLSDTTKKLLSEVDQPIHIKLFFSNEVANGIPYLKTYASRVKRFLLDYQHYSNEQVTVEFIDPKPFSDEEEQALSYGLKGVPIDQNQTKAYFGLVAMNAEKQSRIIPVFTFDREKFTEYELSRIIYDLTHKDKATIGIISSLPMGEQNFMGLPGLKGSRSWLVVQQLEHMFKVKFLDKEATSIPDEIDILMVVQPNQDVKDELIQAIDNYVISGKHAMLFLDPYPEIKGGLVSKDHSYDRRMEPLLNAWGISIPRHTVVLDRLAARKKQDETIKAPVDYLAWLNIRESHLNQEDVTTLTLKSIIMASSGAIMPVEYTHTNITPLMSSTNQAMRTDVNRLKSQTNPAMLLSQFQSEDTSFVLAARIEGEATSAFDASRSGNIQIAVVADVDMLKDELWAKVDKFEGYQLVKPIADNSAFVANMADYLKGNSDLIGLRGRGTVTRPFERVEKIKRMAEEEYVAKEKQLQVKLNQTERRLAMLQKEAKSKSENKQAYKAEQQFEIKRFTEEMAQVQRQMKQLQKAVQEKIEYLGSWLKFINIIVVPALVGFFGIWWFMRRQKP